jgi:uncharacterized membrane protein
MPGSDRQHVETSITVEKDRRSVYERWTRFEEFPSFMKGVEKVERIGDGRLRWTADIGFVERSWEADVVEDTPEKVVAWKAAGELCHDGRVSFTALAPNRTEIVLRMTYDPQGFVEKAGALAGLVTSRIEEDLERFKDLVEDGER